MTDPTTAATNDTTNDTTQAELAERIRRLQARRGSGPKASPDAKRSKTRRRPGGATRIMLAGLSVTGFFSMLTAMGIARQHAIPATIPAASTPAVTTPATPSGAATTPATPTGATPAPGTTKSAPAPPPVTSTHSS